MESREQQITEEMQCLWREVFGAQPPPQAAAAELLDMILRNVPEVSYDRLASPFLRPSTITRPRGQDDGETKRA